MIGKMGTDFFAMLKTTRVRFTRLSAHQLVCPTGHLGMTKELLKEGKTVLLNPLIQTIIMLNPLIQTIMKTNLLRNMLAATVALFTALFALPQTAQAKDFYAIYIADTQVTSDNCNDLSVIDGVSGTVNYDHSTKTLTLDNARIKLDIYGGYGDRYYGIYSEIDNLTVKLIGTNTIMTRSSTIFHTKPMTITGGGTLNAESQNRSSIIVDGTSLTIDGCTVNAKGGWGIIGSAVNGAKTLIIRNATVTAEGRNASIRYFNTFTLDGCAITSPAGAVWNAEKKAVYDASGNIIKSKVTIEPVTTYDLEIAGTKVNSANCNDLSVIPGVSGTVKYDHSTRTLTLDNAAINAGGDHNCIASYIDGLTVKLTGTNTVTAGKTAVVHARPMTLTGGGTLNAEGTNSCGIFVNKTSLTIDGCNVNAKGRWGIVGNDGSSETLTIRNAAVTAEGTEYGSIRNFNTLTLDGCAITSPTGAVWNAGKHAVCDASGNIIKSKVTIKPVTFYDLEIAGTKVNSANCNNLSVIPGVSGTVEYDHSTRTLTLHNAAINAGGNEKGIYSQIDNLTVKLTGTNTVTAVTAKSAAVLHTKPMTITGGTLNAESTGYPGIYAYKTSLTIDGCTVNAKGEWGIAGYNGTTETLTIRNATVTAEGRDGSIRHFNTLTLEGCKITSPAGAVWNAEKKAVCDASGNIIKSKVTIKPVTFYDLEIAGTKVTSTNCNDLSVIPGVSGTVKYDHSTRTLTLDNAAINAGGNEKGIHSQIDNLTVKLIGTNTVTAVYTPVLHTKPMTLTGGGTLNAESTKDCGIYVFKTSLTIDGCIVNAKGKWGIAGNDGSSETLTIRNATVTAEGTAGSIRDLRTLTLDGCAITSPAVAVWNDGKHAVCDASGNIIKSKVTIEPVTAYDLWIAGTQVTPDNCNDLSVIDGVSGTVNYDHSTRTLTLDNAAINAGDYRGIYSKIDGLTVKLTGTNTVTAEARYVATIGHTKPMTLTGSGTLNAEGTNNCGIYTDETSLTIDGCTVNAKGKWGIAGNGGTSESLTLRNAAVTAEGTDGSICDLRTLTLEGCKITSPAGAVWNAGKHAVCDASGNIITDKVTITRDTNGIETVTVDLPAGKRGVYNLQGLRLGDSLEHLPAGVYIYNGKKIIIKK